MAKSKEVNIIANNIVDLIDNRYESDNIPQELLNHLYLAVFGLSISLGTDYVDDIFNALKKISFIDKVKFNTTNNYYVVPKLNEYADINYQLFIKNVKNGDLNTLEFIIKEIINVMCLNNSNLSDSDKLIYEVIRSLTTEDVINSVLYLKCFEYENSKFSYAINDIKGIEDEYYAQGLENIVNLFRPLFKFKTVKELLVNNLLNGSYNDIYKEFDNVLGANSFNNMINSLKKINSDLSKKNIPTYKVACSYLNIRNKFVQNYISLKFSTI